MSMVRKNFYLTEEQEKFLQGLEGKSVSEHIRRAIDDYIIKKKIEHSETSVSPSKSRFKITYFGKEIKDEQSV